MRLRRVAESLIARANSPQPGSSATGRTMWRCRLRRFRGQRTGEGRKRAQAKGVKFGRKSKLTAHQRAEALQRRAAGETLAAIAKSYAVDVSTISRL